jgi:hypothetical protein
MGAAQSGALIAEAQRNSLRALRKLLFEYSVVSDSFHGRGLRVRILLHAALGVLA